MRLANPVNREVFWFKVGAKKIRFSLQEFALVTGFLVGNDSNVDKCVGKESNLVKKYFKNLTVVYRKHVWQKFKSTKIAVDRYKLGLIVILTYVVWASEEKCAVDWWIFQLVEDLDAFNKYPWGNESYDSTVHVLRRDLKDVLKKDPIAYTFYGFPYALKVWALEAIPSLRKFSVIVDENALPRMMKWGNAKRVNSALVEVVLESGEVDVVPKLVPSEAEKEKAYFVILPEVEVEDDESTCVNAPDQSTGNVDYEKVKELVKIAVSEENKRMCEELVKIAEENKRMCVLVDTLQRKVELMEVRLSNEELNEMEDESVEASRNGKGNSEVEEKEAGEGDEEGVAIVNEAGDGDEEVGEFPPQNVSEGDEELGDEPEPAIEETVEKSGNGEGNSVNEEINEDIEMEEGVAEKLNDVIECDIREEGQVDIGEEGDPNGEGNAVGEEDDLEKGKAGMKKVVKVVRFNLPTPPKKRKSIGSPYIKVPKKRKENKSDAYNPFRKMDPVMMKSLDKFIESCEDSVQVSLVDCDIDASVLKNIVRGASLPSNVMDSSLCEIRRRCLDPNMFDQNARVMDTFFASYVKAFHTRHMIKKRGSGGGFSTVCKGRFDKVFMNIVKGAAPELSKSWEGCTTLYVPMIEREHWFLLKIDLSGRTIYVYDSLPGHVKRVLLASCVTPMQVVIPLLLKKYVKGYENYSLGKLAVKSVDCPSQDNRSDCGIFVIKFVEFMLGGVDLSLIRSGHVPDWRKKLVVGLLSRNLQT